MHRFPAPRKPSGFEAAMKKHRAAANGPNPSFDESVWKGYKDQLSRAQKRKCGFCEVRATGASYGDVEHYRPKGKVCAIKTRGKEVRDLVNVEGRTETELSSTGYWWLAYSWENWLLSCEICNRGWKRSFFRVAGETKTPLKRKINRAEAAREKPLLLNPFRGPRPGKHLKFGNLGEVEPRGNSPHGRATIEVCGLGRPSLRESRLDVAERIFTLLDRIQDEGNPQRVDDALRDILRAGREDKVHCGMVRAIFEEETVTAWKELERRVAALPAHR
jgi:hypothetical protein